MTPAVTFAVPGSLATPTGGYAYDRRVIAELKMLGCGVDVVDLGDGFPRPSQDTRIRAQAALAGVPEGRLIIVDGLALGVLPEAAEALQTTHRLIALVHHPLALETGMPAADADALRGSERAALAAVRHVIVSSPTTARLLIEGYGVADSSVTIACPGTDRALRVAARRAGPMRLLAVGSLVPRKGYDVLLSALAQLADLDWRLTIVGDGSRSPSTSREIEGQIIALGLGFRVTLAGAVASERLASFYAVADVFVLASRYEGYGMAFAEAIAHGLPVVGTTAGAIPETVPEDTGILVSPDDVPALTSALRSLISDGELRGRLASSSWKAADSLPTWQATAQAFLHVLRTVA